MKRMWIFLICISLSFVLPASAQTGDPMMAELQRIISEQTAQVERWNRNAILLITLTIIVGLLGIVSGALANSQLKWNKKIVTAAGICVTALTVIMNTLFPVDHRTYSRLACDVQQLIDEIRVQMTQLKTVDDAKIRFEMAQKTIVPKLNTIYDIKKKQFPVSISYSFMVQNAYAGDEVPGWVTLPPKEPNTLYFVGIGVSNDLAKAEISSYNYAKDYAIIILVDALENAIGQQRAEIPSRDRILQTILESSTIVEKFVKYNPEQKMYRYFCLLKIDIESAEIRLKLLEKGANVQIPTNLIDILKRNTMP